MKRRLTPRTLGIATGVFLLAFAAFGWFVLVGPKRAAASDLKAEVAAAEAAVVAARAALAQSENAEPIEVADIFRLATAMPADADMPGLLLELSRLAEETGIEFNSITPQESTAATGYQLLPVQVVFDGNFYELSDFLFRLRSLVRVRGGELDATGRLFNVISLNFVESDREFPRIKASLSIAAYVYGTGATPTPAAPPAEPAPPGAPAQPAPPGAPPVTPPPAPVPPASPAATAAGAS